MKRYIRRVDKISPTQNVSNDKKKIPDGRKSFQEEMEHAIAKEKQKK